MFQLMHPFKCIFTLLCLMWWIFSCEQKQVTVLIKPEDNRFTTTILAEQLDEPMQFKLFPDGRVLFVERKGKIKVFDPETSQVSIIGDIPVSVGYYSETGEELEPSGEDGMQSVAIDPNFDTNGWIYLFYSPEGGEPRSILTRYEWKGDSLVMDSKKVLLEIPNQRESCCHLGGGLIFDKDGNLLLSTGDNTPNDPLGYAPLDERKDRSRFDSQRSSANSNDLRGKILRIHPEPDGSYSIPEGNLFPVGMDSTRAEIYTMGNRNPWRLSIDSKTGWIYWGEVGPFGTIDSVGRGPRSYDEFNQARNPGNFGWPYFLADNKAYWEYDYETGQSFEQFNPGDPVNKSPNNSGLRHLPPTEPALIWYPQSQAVDFPLLGSGSNSAVGGPVYRRDDFHNPKRPFPDYYEGKWFITDWTRGWIMAVTMDEKGDFQSMEKFFPGINLIGPIDMDFGPDGDLYVMEYGRGPYRRNQEARLIRIEYIEGNRKPEVKAAASENAGALPFKVKLSSEGTVDFDGDSLEFTWKIISPEGKTETLKEVHPEVILNTSGIYTAELTVKDAKGAESSKSIPLYAGNEPPRVEIDFHESNKSFFFTDHKIEYAVKVSDQEDGNLGQGLAPSEIPVQIDYLSNDFYLEELKPLLSSTPAIEPLDAVIGTFLIEKNGCPACHVLDQPAAGPAYLDIAKRYSRRPDAVKYLSKKIILGSSGNWGSGMAMPAHPTLREEDVEILAKYILGLRMKDTARWITHGSYLLRAPENDLKGRYVFRVSYTDRGGIASPRLTSSQVTILRSPIIPVIAFDEFIDLEILHSILPEYSDISPRQSGAAMVLENIDLTGIHAIQLSTPSESNINTMENWLIEVRVDSLEGKILGSTDKMIQVDGKNKVKVEIGPTADYHDIYLVFRKKNENMKNANALKIRSVTFLQKQEFKIN